MSNTCSKDLQREIAKLKEEKNAVILAHSYQRVEIQEIADFVGDSLELSMMAMDTNADIIVFCGVDFMAETAAILNPDKTVLIPIEARCPMASQLNVEMVLKAKETGLPFVAYVNTHAEVKAEADICCTSANVAKVVGSLDSDEVLLGPDKNLAWFAEWKTGKKVTPVPKDGHCYVHVQFKKEDIDKIREMYPNSPVIVHPECNPEVQLSADYVGSTSQMVKFVKDTNKRVVIGTEIGLIERLRRDNYDVIPLKCVVCNEMKMNTLKAVLRVLMQEDRVVEVPRDIARKARKSIMKMIELSRGERSCSR
jgi:quinolinate synthase